MSEQRAEDTEATSQDKSDVESSAPRQAEASGEAGATASAAETPAPGAASEGEVAQIHAEAARAIEPTPAEAAVAQVQGDVTQAAPTAEPAAASAEDQQAFETAMKEMRRGGGLEHGALVRGTIAAIQDDYVLVSIGGKSEAVMDRKELDEQQVGDEVEAVVIETGQEIRISKKLAAGRRSVEQVRQAREAGLPVEGRITGKNKGGFEVRVAGLRGFCPFSQMGIPASEGQEAKDAYVGRTLPFRIIEFSDSGRRLVLSRQAMVREENQARIASLWRTLETGDVRPGVVRSLTTFGAFVDIGEGHGRLEGLVHVSEVSRRRVDNPSDVLKVGQAVQVKVLKVDRDKRKLSLSMKQLEEDPWARVEEKYGEGAPFAGRVVRATSFGLFIEVEPGLEGLVHVSQIPRGVKPKDDSLAVGATVSGWVREVDRGKRRLSLSLREVVKGDPWKGVEERYPAGTIVEGVVEKGMPFGAFVQIEPGLSGLIPVSEMELPPGGDPGRAYRPGQKVKVKVLQVDPKGKRLSLSPRAAAAEAEKSEYKSYVQSAVRPGGEPKAASTSAFGDALKQALQGRDAKRK